MIIKIDKDTVKLVSEKIIDLKPLRNNIQEFNSLAEQVDFVIIDERLSQEIKDILLKENSERELQKSYFLEQARINEEELKNYE